MKVEDINNEKLDIRYSCYTVIVMLFVKISWESGGASINSGIGFWCFKITIGFK